MKRRKRPDDPTVSLFPFLTVLICTIGMLIVLLVISVRAVGSKSQQLAERNSETQRTELAQLQADLDLHELRAEGWAEIRETRIGQLRSAKEERGYLEQTLRDLGDEAKHIAAQLQELETKVAPSESLRDEERKNEKLRQQLDEERKKPDEAAPLADAPVMYNLVPYAGTGGTSRRPIYVECVDQKLILQPSGIELRVADFVVPGEPGNPLDAALSTIKEYWRRYDLAGAEGAPYPLLVVRPSGAQAYAVARRAMTSWVDEFGYELIPENKPIRFGTDDPQLAAEIRKAVELARKNQASLAEQIQYRERVLQQRAIARQMATGGGGGGGLRADRARGGFTSDSRYASTHNQDGSGAAAVKKLLGSEVASSEKSNENSTSPAADSSTSAALPSGEPSPTENTQFQLASRSGDKAGEDSPNQFRPSSSKASDPAFQPSNLTKPPTSDSSAGSAGAKSAGNGQASNSKGEGGPSALSSGNAPPPLADSRGADWALPGKNSPRATAYLRPIRVICSADELVIVTGPNSPLAQNLISFGNSTDTAVEPLVASLWRLIDSWGPTPDNGYWKPVLKVETLPGGEARTRDLQALMLNSGIDLAEEKQ